MSFDPQAFLDMTTDQANVKRPPIAAADYKAVIGQLGSRPWQSTKDTSKSGIAFDVPLTIDVPAEEQARIGLDMPTVQVKDSIMLDLTPSGGLDMSPGKNAGLRRYRDATGLNVPGQPFNPRMLEGKVITAKIGHREYPEGSGDFFEDVKGVAKA